MFLFSKKQPPEVLLAKLNTIYDLMQKNQLTEALRLLNEFLKQAPNNAKALAYRGEVQGRLGNISEAIKDLKKSVSQQPTAPAYFNLALAYLHSKNNTESFAALLRALQLEPHDQEGWALRDNLAKALGLEELDKIARIVERFGYSQCGSGEEWKVEIRQMYQFIPNQPHEEYNAVILDLCQQPTALVQIRAVLPEYKITINYEKVFPGVSQRALVEAVTRSIPASDNALLSTLEGFIKEDILLKDNRCLRYTPEQESA